MTVPAALSALLAIERLREMGMIDEENDDGKKEKEKTQERRYWRR